MLIYITYVFYIFIVGIKYNIFIFQIYFCSRTHSQLSQFIAEIKKSPYSSVRTILLASRQNYCINKTVKNLKHLTLINER